MSDSDATKLTARYDFALDKFQLDAIASINDGLNVLVNWEKMGVSASVFIPCINTEACQKQAKEVFDMFGWKMVSQVCIENYRLGLRIWRTT